MESLMHRAVASAAATAVAPSPSRGGRDLLDDIERVRTKAKSALGASKRPSVHRVQQVLVRRGARDLAQELAQANQGRRAVAHPQGADLAERVEAALIAEPQVAVGRGEGADEAAGGRPSPAPEDVTAGEPDGDIGEAARQSGRTASTSSGS